MPATMSAAPRSCSRRSAPVRPVFNLISAISALNCSARRRWLGWLWSCLVPFTQICGRQLGFHRGRRAEVGDPAPEHDPHPVGDAQHGTRELLDHENRDAPSRRPARRSRTAARRRSAPGPSTARRAATRRIGRQGARHREHLLLAARQRSGELAPALAEPGEARVGDSRSPAAASRCGSPSRGSRAPTGSGRSPCPSGIRHTPRRASSSGGGAVDPPARDEHVAAGRRQLARDHPQRGRLPAAVRSEQRDEAAEGNGEIDAAQDGTSNRRRRTFRSARARGRPESPVSSCVGPLTASPSRGTPHERAGRGAPRRVCRRR